MMPLASSSRPAGMLSWLHIGDLHITDAGQQNYRDLRALVEAANANLAGRVDFAVLPGDNADDGTGPQFRLVRDAIDRLHLPVHILPGDHDVKPGNLDDFHAVLGADRLPTSRIVAGTRCLFLDVVSAGAGGPDFRLADDQLAWLRRELAQAREAGERAVIFMHTYPADLTAGGDVLRRLIAAHDVAAVDMGHTHYNELANDGHTIYAATRSTGQIEEGPVGFSIGAVDGRVFSWRFKPLAAAWPFVLITSPADRRLVTDPAAPDQVVAGRFAVRARIFGAAIRHAACRIDDGAWRRMAPVPGDDAIWQAAADAPGRGFALTVRAEDQDGRADQETIEVACGAYRPPPRRADGSDADAVGAWPEKGILGTRLGPNRNGHAW